VLPGEGDGDDHQRRAGRGKQRRAEHESPPGGRDIGRFVEARQHPLAQVDDMGVHRRAECLVNGAVERVPRLVLVVPT
jgi:hypothetical protein